jgi:hypothetical protein
LVFAPELKNLSRSSLVFKVNPKRYNDRFKRMIPFELPTTDQGKLSDVIRRFLPTPVLDFPDKTLLDLARWWAWRLRLQVDQFGNPLSGSRKALFYNDRTA